jgi:hypothetical protein
VKRAKPSAPRTPPVTDDDTAPPKGRESPSTTAVSAPSSTVGWHATVGAAPQARGATALARFGSVLFMLALIALTPHVAMLTCVPAPRAARRTRGSCSQRRRAVQHAAVSGDARAVLAGLALQAVPCRPWPSARLSTTLR